MKRVVVPEKLRALLENLAKPFDLFDEKGEVLARVYPHVEFSEYETCEPPITEEELQAREGSMEWYTTAEVLAFLEKLQSLESDAIELCDESGKVLARVYPHVEISRYEPCEPPISEEELERRLQSNEKRYTTEEVLRYLDNLRPPA